jgi:hypothetical protein
MMLTTLLAASVLMASGPQSAPMDQPAYMLGESDGRGDYVSSPQETGPRTMTAWSWSVTSRIDGTVLVDAFLNEYDCETSRFRRIRQERYRNGALYDTRVSDAGFRPAWWLEMEARILKEVCGGTLHRLPGVDSIPAATPRLAVGRP